jgi:hypothetical protein
MALSVPREADHHRVRRIWIEPLIVSWLTTCRPLFRRASPAGRRGGKSRFRGIDFHLDRLLVDRLPQSGQRLPYGFFTLVNDRPVVSLVDRRRYLL